MPVMTVGKAATGLVCAAVAWFAGCGAESPMTLREVTLALEYSGPGSVPPSTDVACPHHYAPSNLTVQTDWEVDRQSSIRLEPRSEGRYGVTLAGVPTNAEHWVVVFDIRLCGLNPHAPPVATSGLLLNGVALTRQVITPDGLKALAFRVDAVGAVHP